MNINSFYYSPVVTPFKSSQKLHIMNNLANVHVHLHNDIHVQLYVHMYVHVYTCTCIYIYIYCTHSN